MKKLLLVLVIILAIVLILLVAGGFYVYQTLKPFLISSSSANINQSTTTQNVISGDKHPLLSPSQEATLEKIGIDPAKLPTTITPAMETCFTDKLGIDRVSEIKAGAEPKAIDFFKAKSCVE